MRITVRSHPNTKRAGGVAQSVGPEFKPWYRKTSKQTNKQTNKQKKNHEYIFTYEDKMYLVRLVQIGGRGKKKERKELK
jgi:hypothetical protein